MKLKISLIVFAVFCIGIIVYANFRYKVFESDVMLMLDVKYFLIPLFVIVTPACYIFYRAIILPEEDYISPGFNRTLKIIQGTLTYTVSICLFLIFTLHSLTLITNEYMGYKMVFLDSKVVRSYRTVHHGNVSYYLVLSDKSGKKTNLKVEKLYEKGTLFDGSFKLGYWGILYNNS